LSAWKYFIKFIFTSSRIFY